MKAPPYSTLIIALLITVGAVIFSFQNDGEVFVQFLQWEATGSIAVVLLVTFALGVLATTLALLPTLMRAIANASTARREAKRIGKELHSQKKHAQELVEEVAKARGAAEQAQKDAQQLQKPK